MKAILLLHLALLPLAFSGSGEPTPGGEVPPPTIEVTLQNSQNHIVAKLLNSLLLLDGSTTIWHQILLKRGGKEVAWCYGTSIELSKWNLDRSKVSSCAPTYPFSFDDVTCDMVDSQVPDAEWLAIKSLKASTGARVSCREKDSQCCGDDGIQNKC
ncbi:hypothetical protein IE53DRAFT_363411 [Violaceomyces palustris]|uniref:Uncharacterized protein n=1 Tax=Violaceomyces palustris TaxID=1673888 RepID=A0ACD0NTB5_9BASI|nr:hypothetical protein IE53DRAFT_363411 [Violaceomyces palustris]